MSRHFRSSDPTPDLFGASDAEPLRSPEPHPAPRSAPEVIAASNPERRRTQPLTDFHRRVSAAYGGPVDLKVNDNRSTLLSVNRPRGGGPPKFSVHRMFLDAPDDVVKALGQYLRRATPACRATLRRYMDSRMDEVRTGYGPAGNRNADGKGAPGAGGEVGRGTPAGGAAAPSIPLRARGLHHDLDALARAVDAEWFGGALKPRITYSRGRVSPARGGRRHIIFGSWDFRAKLVRIHPALDSADVPAYFVSFVIYHELLHAVLDPLPTPSGRRCVHTAEFRRREKLHPDYARSMDFEREFMARR